MRVWLTRHFRKVCKTDFACPLPRSGRIFGRKLPNSRPMAGCLLHREFGKGTTPYPAQGCANRTPRYPALFRVRMISDFRGVSGERERRAGFAAASRMGRACGTSQADAVSPLQGGWRVDSPRLFARTTKATPSAKPFAARRVFCSSRHRRPGCGRTFGVWLADKIRRLSITTHALWRFLQRVAGSITAACRVVAGCRRSDRTWQRIWRRFHLGQSKLRTALSACSPPPIQPAASQLTGDPSCRTSPGRLSRRQLSDHRLPTFDADLLRVSQFRCPCRGVGVGVPSNFTPSPLSREKVNQS